MGHQRTRRLGFRLVLCARVSGSQSIGLYNTTIPTTLADAEVATRPNKILRDIMKTAYEAAAQQEQERFDALERAGFRVDRVTPMMDNILIRYGGYYIDIGTSSRIASGEIKVKSGVPIDGFTPDGLRFADGSELKSDVIVVATGQDHDYRNQVATIVGKDMAGRLGEFWGLDEEGEMRNVMKPAGEFVIQSQFRTQSNVPFSSRPVAYRRYCSSSPLLVSILRASDPV
jgi:hypothetical protein